MDNQIKDAQDQHERDMHASDEQPPVVVQNTQEGGGGGGVGVVAVVALVALVLVGIWWFGFGPGTGGGGTTPTNEAPPAASSAPIQSAPAP
jgi:hypothetical protein